MPYIFTKNFGLKLNIWAFGLGRFYYDPICEGTKTLIPRFSRFVKFYYDPICEGIL